MHIGTQIMPIGTRIMGIGTQIMGINTQNMPIGTRARYLLFSIELTSWLICKEFLVSIFWNIYRFSLYIRYMSSNIPYGVVTDYIEIFSYLFGCIEFYIGSRWIYTLSTLIVNTI